MQSHSSFTRPGKGNQLSTMLARLFSIVFVFAGVMDSVNCAATTCGPCTDAEETTCGTASGVAAYCVYKTDTGCTDATKRNALLDKLKAQTGECNGLTGTCKCEFDFIKEKTQTCTTKEDQVKCVYKATGAGCGGVAEDYASAKKYVSGVVTDASPACTGLTATCKCEVE